MKRRGFLKLSGFSTGSVLAATSALAFLSSWRKHEMPGMDMGGARINITARCTMPCALTRTLRLVTLKSGVRQPDG